MQTQHLQESGKPKKADKIPPALDNSSTSFELSSICDAIENATKQIYAHITSLPNTINLFIEGNKRPLSIDIISGLNELNTLDDQQLKKLSEDLLNNLAIAITKLNQKLNKQEHKTNQEIQIIATINKIIHKIENLILHQTNKDT